MIFAARSSFAARLAALMLALSFAPTLAAAAPPRWQRASPDGGRATALAASGDGRVLYLAAVTLVLRSDDGGRTWTPRGSSAFEPDGIYRLAVDPRDADTVWAAGYASQVLRTVDGGRTWNPAGNLPAGVLQFSFDPSDADRLYAATGSGLFVSVGGALWAPVGFTAGGGSYVAGIAVDPRDSSRLFATVWEPQSSLGRVWRSVDRGITWTATPLPADADQPRGLVLDPARPGTFYLPSNGLTYRTTDGGATWQPLTRQIRSLSALLPSPSGRLFAAGNRVFGTGIPYGVVRSDDGGRTWTPDATIVEPRHAAPYDSINDLVLVAGDDELLAAGDQGLWRSQSGGRGWTASSKGLSALEAFALTVEPSGGALFASFGAGPLVTRDAGATWRRPAPSAALQPRGAALIADPSRPGTLYSPTYGLRTVDGGRHWTALTLPGLLPSGYPYNTEIVGFAADPASAGGLYAIGWTGVHSDVSPFFLHSDDFGVSWTTVDFPGFESYATPSALTVGADGALYVSVIGAASGLYRGDNGGRHWAAAGAGLPRPRNGAGITTALVGDPARAGVLYAVVDGVIYRSGNRGGRFERLAGNLPVGELGSLVVEPGTGRLFAGVANAGVFAFDPATSTWKKLANGLPNTSGSYGERFRGKLALDAVHRRLYAATYRGVYRLDL